jgi:hypothetical protein
VSNETKSSKPALVAGVVVEAVVEEIEILVEDDVMEVGSEVVVVDS